MTYASKVGWETWSDIKTALISRVEIFCLADLAGFLLKVDSTIANTEAKIKSLLKKKAHRSLTQIWSKSIFDTIQNSRLPFLFFEAYLISEISLRYHNLNKTISLIFPFTLSLITLVCLSVCIGASSPWNRGSQLQLNSGPWLLELETELWEDANLGQWRFHAECSSNFETNVCFHNNLMNTDSYFFNVLVWVWDEISSVWFNSEWKRWVPFLLSQAQIHRYLFSLLWRKKNWNIG